MDNRVKEIGLDVPTVQFAAKSAFICALMVRRMWIVINSTDDLAAMPDNTVSQTLAQRGFASSADADEMHDHAHVLPEVGFPSRYRGAVAVTAHSIFLVVRPIRAGFVLVKLCLAKNSKFPFSKSSGRQRISAKRFCQRSSKHLLKKCAPSSS